MPPPIFQPNAFLLDLAITLLCWFCPRPVLCLFCWMLLRREVLYIRVMVAVRRAGAHGDQKSGDGSDDGTEGRNRFGEHKDANMADYEYRCEPVGAIMGEEVDIKVEVADDSSDCAHENLTVMTPTTDISPASSSTGEHEPADMTLLSLSCTPGYDSASGSSITSSSVRLHGAIDADTDINATNTATTKKPQRPNSPTTTPRISPAVEDFISRSIIALYTKSELRNNVHTDMFDTSKDQLMRTVGLGSPFQPQPKHKRNHSSTQSHSHVNTDMASYAVKRAKLDN